MASLAELPLDGGGSILIEASEVGGGPVKAGRLGDAVHELPATLQTALAPVTRAAKDVLEELRKAQPTVVEVEFGIDLAMQAGAVITKAQTACHLKVRLTWRKSEADGDGG